jgi:class 3 adenylate cyclase/pimeloyl-ACP methyl ester carboxylesterase
LQKPETHYAKSGDVYIAYQVSGSGPFDLVLAPGTVSHLDLDWERPARAEFLNKLGSVCRLIRFDKRGTGLSDRPTEMATLEVRADDIRAVMDAVGLERAVVFGVSEGASMACMFAASHPERVQALITWGAMAKWVNTTDHPWGMDREETDRMIQDVRDNWPSDWYIRGPGAGVGQAVPREMVDLMKAYMRAAASPSAAAAYEEMNAIIDTRPILGSIKVPTMVMNRVGDPLAIIEGVRDMAKRIPGAVLKEYPGNTHAIMIKGGSPGAPCEPSETWDMDRVIGDIQEFVTGVRPAPIIDDRVLATVMFVDIANSTQMLSDLGDKAWKGKLDAYYSLVRTEVPRYRGKETNTAGDGIMASFDGPARAVRCASAIVAGVKPLGLEVRAGVHTGEVELMGDNIGGIAVHIASRVQSEASPGQVVVSRTVKDLSAGSGINFSEIGEKELKGVPDKWSLYAVAI